MRPAMGRTTGGIRSGQRGFFGHPCLASRRLNARSDMTMTAENEAARRNATLARDDIEWAVGPTGLYLRDKPGWTRQHTAEIARRHERDRQQWLRNARRPA